MNKSELVQNLANKTKMTKAEASRAVDALFNPGDGIISDSLKKGEKVQITGFGTFETRARQARTGRNPRTGEALNIKAARLPKFRAGKALKDAIN